MIVALAAFQAYAQRYAVSPDGMSYLDLSDAVVSGRWGGLVNLYWSPLYPFLIGVARLLSGAGAAGEVAAVHAVNVACFVALFAAFEYFLIQVLEISARRRGGLLAGPWGVGCAYALFGAVALSLNPLELTTPDLLSNAAILVALGALLRIHDRAAPARRDAVVLGAALGLGLLAKSFLVPWAIVCFAALALDRRGRGFRPLFVAVGVWALFVVPWTAVLSARAGRLTFGDAGRLTYAWYVNEQDQPSLRVVPAGARTADTDALLPGIGLTGDAPGTDPMWFDPARWNAPIRAHFAPAAQLATLETMTATLVGSISVLIFILLAIAIAPPGTRRAAWRDGWIVLLPSLAGIAAYTAVILTARYIMSFVLASVLIVLATIPAARRIRPTLLLVGLVASIAPLAVAPVAAFGFSFVTGVACAMIVGTLVPLHRRILWMVCVPLALILSILILSPNVPALMRLGGAVFVIGLWALSTRAIRRGRPVRFAVGMQTALALSVGVILVGRLALRLARDIDAAGHAGPVSPEWRIAEELRAHGITPGTRIALVGPHAESYWARTARLKIVADVPDPLTDIWWELPTARRDSVLALFARGGAQVAIVTRPPKLGSMSAEWTQMRYGGWMRRLTPSSR